MQKKLMQIWLYCTISPVHSSIYNKTWTYFLQTFLCNINLDEFSFLEEKFYLSTENLWYDFLLLK